MKQIIQNIFSGTRARIFTALIISFVAVKLAAPAIFVAETPRVNKKFYAGIFDFPNRIALLPVRLKSDFSKLSFFTNKTQKAATEQFANVKQVENLPQNVVVKAISKGVSAAENTETGEKYVIINKGTKFRVVGYMYVNGLKMPKVEFVK